MSFNKCLAVKLVNCFNISGCVSYNEAPGTLDTALFSLHPVFYAYGDTELQPASSRADITG